MMARTASGLFLKKCEAIDIGVYLRGSNARITGPADKSIAAVSRQLLVKNQTPPLRRRHLAPGAARDQVKDCAQYQPDKQ